MRRGLYSVESRDLRHFWSARYILVSLTQPKRINSYVRLTVIQQSTAAAIIQFARFIMSLQLDQEPEETELGPCFLAYPTWLNAFAIPVRALSTMSLPICDPMMGLTI